MHIAFWLGLLHPLREESTSPSHSSVYHTSPYNPLSELLGQVGDLIDEGGAHREVFCAEGWDRGQAAGRKDRT
jgi:hypothetical protein